MLAAPSFAQIRYPSGKRGYRPQGTVVAYTKSKAGDYRIASEVLGQKRDLLVYLPPGYAPTRAYSMILWMHRSRRPSQ